MSCHSLSTVQGSIKRCLGKRKGPRLEGPSLSVLVMSLSSLCYSDGDHDDCPTSD